MKQTFILQKKSAEFLYANIVFRWKPKFQHLQILSDISQVNYNILYTVVWILLHKKNEI